MSGVAECGICLEQCGDGGKRACPNCTITYHRECLVRLEAGCPICDRPAQQHSESQQTATIPPSYGYVRLHIVLLLMLAIESFIILGAGFGVVLWATRGMPNTCCAPAQHSSSDGAFKRVERL